MDYKQIISDLINIEGTSKEEIYSLLSFPKDSSMGDYCLPCFKFAKTLRKSPIQIAQDIQATIPVGGVIESVEAVSGYVNFKLNKVELAKQCEDFSESIDTGNLDVVSTIYRGNVMLIIILPIITDSQQVQLSLGITTNKRGELIYNFVENEIQKI